VNNERVDAFASRPRSLTELCGNIHFQGTIKQQLIQGLPEYLRTDCGGNPLSPDDAIPPV